MLTHLSSASITKKKTRKVPNSWLGMDPHSSWGNCPYKSQTKSPRRARNDRHCQKPCKCIQEAMQCSLLGTRVPFIATLGENKGSLPFPNKECQPAPGKHSTPSGSKTPSTRRLKPVHHRHVGSDRAIGPALGNQRSQAPNDLGAVVRTLLKPVFGGVCGSFFWRAEFGAPSQTGPSPTSFGMCSFFGSQAHL